MRLKKFFALLVFSLASALGLSAQSVRVIFVSGQAEIQAPGETNLRAAAKGEVVTLGTRIVTGPDGRMALTPMPGVKALISPNTDLRLESASETKMPDGTVTSAATLDLKTGAVVTDLIKQEGVTYDYNIRTPRGLAGARGTNYTVAVNNAGIETILVSHGTIIFNLLDGRRISVTAGQVNITDVTGVVRSAAQLSELSAEDQSLAKSTAENTLSALESAVAEGIAVNPEAISQAINVLETFGADVSESTLGRVARLREAVEKLKEEKSDQEARNVVRQEFREEARDNLIRFLDSLSPAQAAAFSEILIRGEFAREEEQFKIRFADEVFVANLRNTIDLYITLSPSDRSVLTTLGILGNANLAAVGANAQGLVRLIETYHELEIATPALFSEATFTAGSPVHLVEGDTIFFPGTDDNSGQTIFNPAFSNGVASGDLLVGATRFLRISNTSSFDTDYFNFSTSFDLGDDSIFDSGGDSGGDDSADGFNGSAPLASITQFGGSVGLLAGDEISLRGLSNFPVTFSSEISSIYMQAITVNLAHVKFPEGSVAVLISRDGGSPSTLGSGLRIPHFGSSTVGKVNFLSGVYYGENLLDNESAFVGSSRGNIAIYAFSDGLFPEEPSYTPPTTPATPYELFIASLNSSQSAAFPDLLTAGGFDTQDATFLNRFANTDFTFALRNTLDLFGSLSNQERNQAVTLGILGNSNLTALGVDSVGLRRLISAYTALGLGTPSLQNENAYSSVSSTNTNASSHVFFPGTSGNSGNILRNVSFSATSPNPELNVGALKFLLIGNTASFGLDDTNFGVAPAGTISLRAAEQIDLRGLIERPITFSTGARGILIEAITLNLLNVNFPSGTGVALNSLFGGVSNSGSFVPNFGSVTFGRVNFLGGVFYGSELLDSPAAFIAGSRGNIVIGSFDKPAPIPTYIPTADETFVATLTSPQRSIYFSLPLDVRTKLRTLNDPDLTGTILSTNWDNGVTPSYTSIELVLDVYTSLSPTARAFFKTFGGATGTQLNFPESTPDITGWSTATLEAAATKFNALDAATRSALISLGAGDLIVGLQPDYVQGLVSAASDDIPSILAAGWGRFLLDLVTNKALSDVQEAAQTATPNQRGIVNDFNIDPSTLASALERNGGDATPIYSRLDFLTANVSPANRTLLAQLSFNQDADLFTLSNADTLARINAVLSHYSAFTPQQKDAARALYLGSILADSTRATAVVNYYLGLTPLQQAFMRDAGLGSAFFDSDFNTAQTQSRVTFALGQLSSLAPSIRNFLINEVTDGELVPLLTSTSSFFDKNGRNSRSLADIVFLLSNSSSDLITLADMDISSAILFQSYLPGATLNANLTGLSDAVTFYTDLSSADRGTLRGLGIIGAGEVGFLGNDYAGVQRLLTAYTALPLPLRIDTLRLDESQANGRSFTNHSSYFFPSNKSTSQTGGALSSISFESDSDLYVGAVRRLRIDSSIAVNPTDTFRSSGNNTFKLTLRAGDLIDLNSTRLASNTSSILMEAITINLSNFNFPEGSVAVMNSRDGGTSDGGTGSGNYPRWGSSQVGRVNFLTNITYGSRRLDNVNQFDANARGNIAIGSFAAPAATPSYTAPLFFIPEGGN